MNELYMYLSYVYIMQYYNVSILILIYTRDSDIVISYIICLTINYTWGLKGVLHRSQYPIFLDCTEKYIGYTMINLLCIYLYTLSSRNTVVT